MPSYNAAYPQVMTASGQPMAFAPTAVPTNPASCSVDDLWQLAVHILNKVVETYAQCSVSLPSRQYIALSTPAQDCEQVTVAWQQSYIGPPGDEANAPQRCESPRSAVFQVVVTRCIPVADDRGRAPTPLAITEASKTLMGDAWLLLSSVKGWDDYLGVIATVEASEAQGGLQSVVLTLTLGVP